MSRGIVGVGAAAALLLSAVQAAAFSAPGCEGLRAWAATEGPDAPFSAAAAVSAPFSADVSAATFGTPFGAWSDGDLRALDGALNGCQGQARKAKDAPAAGAFGDARAALKAAGRLLREAEKARAVIGKSLAAVDAAAPSPALLVGLNALVAAEPAEMGKAGGGGDLGRIGRAAPSLPLDELAALRSGLAERAARLGDGLEADRIAALDALPATLDGALSARRAAYDARREFGPAGAAIVAAVQAREAEIAAGLAVGEAPPIALPACAALAAHGAGVRPGEGRRTRAGYVMTGLESSALAETFGKGFGAWTAEDVAALAQLNGICREAIRGGLEDGDVREMDRGIQNMATLAATSDNQAAIFAALAASRARADAIVADAGAAQGVEGLGALSALSGAILSGGMEDDDAARAAAAVAERRDALLVEAMAAPLEAFAAAPADAGGLDALLDGYVAATAAPWAIHLTPERRDELREAAAAAARRIAPEALAGFEARIAEVPATEEGAAELDAMSRRLAALSEPALAPFAAAVKARQRAAADAALAAELPALEARLAAAPQTPASLAELLTAVAQFEADPDPLPSRAAFAGSVRSRAEAIRAALATERCAPHVAALSDDDAARPVLVGTGVAPLARFLCDFGRTADGPPTYKGPGFFGSEHVIEATVRGGYAVRMVLREGAAPTGGRALIGARVEDGQGARDISTAEWQQWSGLIGGGPEPCAAALGLLRDAARRGYPADAAHSAAECLIDHSDAPMFAAR
jgi:hypothetical protein